MQQKKFPRIELCPPSPKGGKEKRMQRRCLNLWHRKDFLAPTPSVRQPLFETSEHRGQNVTRDAGPQIGACLILKFHTKISQHTSACMATLTFWYFRISKAEVTLLSLRICTAYRGTWLCLTRSWCLSRRRGQQGCLHGVLLGPFSAKRLLLEAALSVLPRKVRVGADMWEVDELRTFQALTLAVQ